MATGYTHTIATIWTGEGGERMSVSNPRTADAEDNRIALIPPLTTDLEVAISINVTRLLSLVMLATGVPLTIKTNDPDSPDDTFTLAPKWPLTWQSGCQRPNELTANVTKLYVSNASTTASGQLDVRVLQDATP